MSKITKQKSAFKTSQFNSQIHRQISDTTSKTSSCLIICLHTKPRTKKFIKTAKTDPSMMTVKTPTLFFSLSTKSWITSATRDPLRCACTALATVYKVTQKKTFIALFRGDMKVEYEKKKKLKLPSGLGMKKFVDKVRNNVMKGWGTWVFEDFINFLLNFIWNWIKIDEISWF